MYIKIFIPFLVFFLGGCKIYQLTGTQLPTHLKSIAIPLIEDRSRGGVPQMGETLQQQLVDKFIRQNNLRLSADENEADAYIQAYIADFPKYNSRINYDRIQRIFYAAVISIGKKLIFQKDLTMKMN